MGTLACAVEKKEEVDEENDVDDRPAISLWSIIPFISGDSVGKLLLPLDGGDPMKSTSRGSRLDCM